MTKLRGLVFGLTGLIGLLALCAPSVQAVVMPAPASATAGALMPAPLLLQPFPGQVTPPGPVLDPTSTEQANGENTQNKLIAGGVAAVLLVLVIWGRRLKSKKRKKSSDQAKGK